jgi:hypothetical protein
MTMVSSASIVASSSSSEDWDYWVDSCCGHLYSVMNYDDLPESLKNNQDFILKAIDSSGGAYFYGGLPLHWKCDLDICLAFLDVASPPMDASSEKMRVDMMESDVEFVFQEGPPAIIANRQAWKSLARGYFSEIFALYAPPAILSDAEIMRIGFLHHIAFDLWHIMDEKLRDDPWFIASLKGKYLKEARDYIDEMLDEFCGDFSEELDEATFFISDAPFFIRDDPEIMEPFLRLRPWLFPYCSLRLQSYPSFVKTVRQHYVGLTRNYTGEEHNREHNLEFSNAPAFILDDKMIMVEVIHNQPWQFLYCSHRLQHDHEVINLTLQCGGACYVLESLSMEYLLQHPDLVLKCITHFDSTTRDIRCVVNFIPRGMWSDWRVVSEYLKKDGFPHSGIPLNVYRDHRVQPLLLKSALSFGSANPWDILVISHELCMTAAQAGTLFAADLLKEANDDDVVRTPPAIWNSFHWKLETVRYNYIQKLPARLRLSFCEQVTHELKLHDIFTRTVLPCIFCQSSSCSNNLQLLNVGDSSLARLLAEFLGVSRGDRLTALRTVKFPDSSEYVYLPGEQALLFKKRKISP